jgi:hypothetical protein
MEIHGVMSLAECGLGPVVAGAGNGAKSKLNSCLDTSSQNCRMKQQDAPVGCEVFILQLFTPGEMR